MKHSRFLRSAALLLFLCFGCVREEVPTRMAIGVPDGKVNYPPISQKGLSLKLISKPVLYAGEEGQLNFALSNETDKEVQIPEWLSVESQNIHLFIQARLTEMNAPDPAAWVELSTPPDKPLLHYPLLLMPGNKVIVGKKLSFLEKMQISPGHERRFYLKAKLALKSLPMETPVVELRVLPAKTMP